jgi:phosphotransferase system enzyme I (PtsI)
LIPPEIERFRTALRESEKQLLEIKKKLSNLKVMETLYIIDVHIMILKDRNFINRTIRSIKKMCVNAEWAVRMTIDRYRQIFDKVEDEYLKGRFSDIRYVGQMILRNLGGEKQDVIPQMGEGVIIISADLSPADTAQMKIEKVQGFATDIGGKTSHTAIVARSIEIPAVVGLENITRRVRTNDLIIIDGSAGLVIVNPDPEIIRRYKVKKRHYEETREMSLIDAVLPAVTRDSHHVEIGGNIEFIEEIPSVISHGADGIGLYRTEFIYINREQLPTEEDHFSIYKRVVETEKDRKSVV